ncbi:hypothetical protein ACOACO_18445 [Nocardioides sp. CPCC 205120]|uniref:hypothetical protein n=1 Tax=Nocardioides sp. CPCC 205120 TaxID=3406462 RepID=UPI003B511492
MIDGQGLVTMLDAAGHTITDLRAKLADAARAIEERDKAIAHLREALQEARA